MRILDHVGTIQIDAVNVVERTQFLVPFSRIGTYDPALLRDDRACSTFCREFR